MWLYFFKIWSYLYVLRICWPEAAFERCQKRRELFCEQSISPIQIEEGSEPERSEKKPSFRSEIAHLDKHSFLGLLNLESARPPAKKRNYVSFSLKLSYLSLGLIFVFQFGIQFKIVILLYFPEVWLSSYVIYHREIVAQSLFLEQWELIAVRCRLLYLWQFFLV